MSKLVLWVVGAFLLIILLSVVSLGPYQLYKNSLGTFGASDSVMNNPKANVTIEFFSDLTCSYCKSFYFGALDSVIKDYVKTGKVRVILKHYPLEKEHPFALRTAEASECARDQGHFWAYVDRIYRSSDALEDYNLKKYAANLGLNETQFSNCLKSGEKLPLINRDIAEGDKLGVKGVPTIIINGKMITGAVPYKTLKGVIDKDLNATAS